MKQIAVIDADFIGRKNHRFPNLCCMKISGYFKSAGYDVTFKTNYDGLENFHKVYVAKVFTDTPIPDGGGLFGNPLDAPNVIKGGTGFFFDKVRPLPNEIEHHMPDYHLYDGVANHSSYTDSSKGKPIALSDSLGTLLMAQIQHLWCSTYRINQRKLLFKTRRGTAATSTNFYRPSTKTNILTPNKNGVSRKWRFEQ